MVTSAVLNVDDDPSSLYVKSHCLRRAGLQVVEAESGQAALERGIHVDVAVVDAVLPDIPGIEVCRRLKAMYPRLPVVMVSAKLLDPEEQARVLEAGADFFMAEPDPMLLVATTRAVIRARPESRQGQDPAGGDHGRSIERLSSEKRDLEEFAYMLAHDLRDPLRAMRMLGRFITDDFGHLLPGAVAERLDSIDKHGARMGKLIEQMLRYAQAGGGGLSMVPADLGEVTRAAIAQVQGRITHSGATVRIQDPLPTVRCDPVMVAQVFANLIANGVTFNRSAPPHVEVGVLPDGRTFYVQDNGIGIKAADLHEVFTPFKRLDNRAAGSRGTGLGLAIVKRIIERHGGRIWVESVPGSGTRFFFTLAPG